MKPAKAEKTAKPASKTALRRRADAVWEILEKVYPEAKCALVFGTPLQLAVATMLSAQCTDKRVNLVTPELFRRYPDAEAFAAASQEEIEQAIHSVGFFRNKARNIRALAAILLERYGGELPRDLETLVTLPGIGRKTANLLVSTLFDTPGLVVDTHFIRLTNRLGFVEATRDPVFIERAMAEILPRERWTLWGHLMISHGRAVCSARSPACDRCPIAHLCPSAHENSRP
jgi:endonuclease-3